MNGQESVRDGEREERKGREEETRERERKAGEGSLGHLDLDLQLSSKPFEPFLLLIDINQSHGHLGPLSLNLLCPFTDISLLICCNRDLAFQGQG